MNRRQILANAAALPVFVAAGCATESATAQSPIGSGAESGRDPDRQRAKR